jgi:hypothetical protein
VKITTDPTVYAVEPGGELRSIVSEENAIDLYGEDWADMVVDVPDAFFVNYDKKSALTTGEYPTGTIVQEEGGSDVYYVDNGEYREFDGEAAFLANNFKWSHVVTTDETITASGSTISGFDADLFNPAGGATSGGGDVPTGSGLSAALSSSTPAASTIPYNVQGQVYTSVNFTASNDGAVELTGLEVKRTGLGDPDNFRYVYVEVDGTRHGNKRTLGNDNTANLYFNTDSSKITIPAGETVTVDIVADMQDADGVEDTDTSGRTGDNALSIVSASAIDTSATVSGSFPVTGNQMSISSVGAPTVKLDIADTSETDVYLGDEQVEVAEFDVENDTSNEDVSFSQITLENNGSADANEVINYTLYNDNDEVISGPIAADSNDMIKFMLDDAITIEDNRSETFVVKADIYDGRLETVILNLDEETDLKAVGLNNGFNAVVDDITANNGTTYKIQGGDLSFSEASSNPGDVDVAPQDEDVLFLASEVESLEEMMTITEMTFELDITDGTATSLEAVTLYLDGDVVAGPVDVESGDTDVKFDEEFQVSGTQLLEVKADITDTAKDGDYIINLASADDVKAENEEGDDISNSITDTDKIKGTVDGGIITINTGQVDVYTDSTYGGRTLVAGDDMLVGQYIVEAGDAEGVKIDRYIVGLGTPSTGTSVEDVDIDELYISEDDDVVTSVSGDTNFNVTQELAAGENKVVKIYMSIDSDFDVDVKNKIVTTLDVEGEGLVSGEELEVTKQDGQEMTLDTGSLTPDVSAGTPDSAIVIAGTSGVEVAEWEFEAENTSYTLKDIEVTVATTTNFTTDDIEKSLVTSMTLNGETATVINGVATFNGPFEVAKDDDLKLTLLADFNGDFNSISSGDTANFAITEYLEKAGNENTYTTVNTSSDSMTEIYDYETGKLMYARNTVPTFVATAGSTTTLKTLANDIMDIEVTADGSDDVTIGTTTISLISNASSTGEVQLRDSNGDDVGAAVPFDAVTGEQSLDLVWNEEIVPAGQSETYTVRVNFDSAPANDSTLTVSLEDYLEWDDDEYNDEFGTFIINDGDNLIEDLSGSFEIDNK